GLHFLLGRWASVRVPGVSDVGARLPLRPSLSGLQARLGYVRARGTLKGPGLLGFSAWRKSGWAWR
ncbi:Hypothetical predicted protein, partial [Marmota monax]